MHTTRCHLRTIERQMAIKNAQPSQFWIDISHFAANVPVIIKFQLATEHRTPPSVPRGDSTRWGGSNKSGVSKTTNGLPRYYVAVGSSEGKGSIDLRHMIYHVRLSGSYDSAKQSSLPPMAALSMANWLAKRPRSVEVLPASASNSSCLTLRPKYSQSH